MTYMAQENQDLKLENESLRKQLKNLEYFKQIDGLQQLQSQLQQRSCGESEDMLKAQVSYAPSSPFKQTFGLSS